MREYLKPWRQIAGHHRAHRPIEQVIIWLLLQAYRRRLRAIVTSALAWVSEEILSASQRIGEDRPAIWSSEN
jgi:hypothetical protein